jgi:hypothetical protein
VPLQRGNGACESWLHVVAVVEQQRSTLSGKCSQNPRVHISNSPSRLKSHQSFLIFKRKKERTTPTQFSIATHAPTTSAYCVAWFCRSVALSGRVILMSSSVMATSSPAVVKRSMLVCRPVGISLRMKWLCLYYLLILASGFTGRQKVRRTSKPTPSSNPNPFIVLVRFSIASAFAPGPSVPKSFYNQMI